MMTEPPLSLPDLLEVITGWDAVQKTVVVIVQTPILSLSMAVLPFVAISLDWSQVKIKNEPTMSCIEVNKSIIGVAQRTAVTVYNIQICSNIR